MANTVTALSYANTFGHWVTATNTLINENNILAKGDYTKDSGTIYFSETTQNSLQANGNVVVQSALRVQGVGSSTTFDNNLTVKYGQVYFQNTSLGLVNSGNANVGNLVVTGTTDFCAAYQETGIQYLPNIATGGSTNILSNVSLVIVNPNAAIASYTLVMPSAPINGQMIRITFGNTITTLRHTAGSNAIKGPFTTANANVAGQWVYHSVSSTWYKLAGT